MGESAIKKFTNNCKKCLSAQGLHDLRAYGRGIGVEKPTTKKKEELIDDIIGVLSGRIIPIEVSKRGAPVKNDFVKPEFFMEMEQIKLVYLNELSVENGATLKDIAPSTKTDFTMPRKHGASGTTLVVEDSVQQEDSSTLTYKGQLVNLNGVTQLVPLDFQENGEIVIIPNRLMKEYGIKTGDVVSCRAKKKDEVFVATTVLTINELVPHSFERKDFNTAEIVYPTKTLSFIRENGQNSVFSKYVHFLAPICKGQRACIVSSPKAGKTTLLYDMIKSVKSCNPKVEIMALLVDQSPETVSKFRGLVPQNTFIYTTYEDEPERQVFAGDFILERAKRYAECGKDVVIFVDSVNALARAFNETDASSGGKTLAGGLERKTVQYLKKYFGSSRTFVEGGSITIIATISSVTGNPADDIICTETCAIANTEIVLDVRQAFKRVYPAIDPAKTRVAVETDRDFERLDKVLRQKFLVKHTVEELLDILERAETYEELFTLVCAS